MPAPPHSEQNHLTQTIYNKADNYTVTTGLQVVANLQLNQQYLAKQLVTKINVHANLPSIG
jgi:hypothetical protein